MSTIKDEFDGDEKPDFIIAVRGSGGAGKTAFILRFLEVPFCSIPPTLEDYFDFCFERDGKKYKIEFYDTPGAADFYFLCLRAFKVCDGVIFVTNPELKGDGFIIADDLEEIQKIRNTHIPYVTFVNSFRSIDPKFDEKYLTDCYMENIKKEVKSPVYILDPTDFSDNQCLDALYNLLQQIIENKQLESSSRKKSDPKKKKKI